MLNFDLLRPHQKQSVYTSIENNFKSGVHFHATGTGKSWVALYILCSFLTRIQNKKLQLKTSPKPLVIFWICERKSILDEQFDSDSLKKKGFYQYLKDHFNIVNFSKNKTKNWYESIHAAKFWMKPILVIINRSFLTSQNRFKMIKLPIHLVLHDECHSIANHTTQEFYKWLHENNPDVKCIGFSATPSICDKITINPFSEILSKFTIYNACIEDDVIVPPIIERFQLVKSNTHIQNLSDIQVAKCILQRIANQPYKKLVIWAGMIKHCFALAKIWKKVFSDYIICIDTSIENVISKDFVNYDEFYKSKQKAILFCACKHKEGSDIPFLDTCVFLDYVENRGHQHFVQCVGRVLRKDPLGIKKRGLIIDIKANSTIKLCDRLSEAFQLPKQIFPWNTSEEYIKVDNMNIHVHILSIQKETPLSVANEYNSITCDDLVKRFTRKIPNIPIYKKRLYRELHVIGEKNLARYLYQAMDILDMINTHTKIPHVTRGSCGSSLVCYLLGISHIDPIQYQISFARFLNHCRDKLPDVDFDFPYHLRDAIFLQLQSRWPGKIARISNHVHYHEKSARREAIRRAGIHGFIGKSELYNKQMISSWDEKTRMKIEDETKSLLDTFRCYSLHCGGIVYYEDGIPDDILMKDNNDRIKYSTIQQIVLDKHAVADNKRFKIDILSSRGLAQLMDIYQELYPGKQICFQTDDYIGDEKTCKMLERGDNIGITLAESPLIRKAFMKMKPKTLDDMAICLSIIRPAASQAKQSEDLQHAQQYLIFDDDAIHMIKNATGCTEDIADHLRRQLSKPCKKTREKAVSTITKMYFSQKGGKDINIYEILDKLKGLQKYSFCKSHAYSYAQLVWYIAYMKANHPVPFWKATLNHCHSSYRNWVHRFEAFRAGVNWRDQDLSVNERSIYSHSKRKNKDFVLKNMYIHPIEQLKKTGFWNTNITSDIFFPECYGFETNQTYKFRGIIASIRVYRSHSAIIYLGIDTGVYIDIHISSKLLHFIKKDSIGIKGSGRIKNTNPLIIQAEYIYSF